MTLTRENLNESHAIATSHLEFTEEADELQRICSDRPLRRSLLS